MATGNQEENRKGEDIERTFGLDKRRDGPTKRGENEKKEGGEEEHESTHRNGGGEGVHTWSRPETTFGTRMTEINVRSGHNKTTDAANLYMCQLPSPERELALVHDRRDKKGKEEKRGQKEETRRREREQEVFASA